MNLKTLGIVTTALISLSPLSYADHRHHDHHDHHYYHGGRSSSGLSLFGSFGAGVVFGSIVSTLPHQHTTVYVRDTPYYCHNGVYYRSCDRGYVIVSPPQPQPIVIYNSTPVETVRSPVSSVDSTSFYKRGRDWGMDLRDDVASREDFINYLRSSVPNSGTNEYQDFRRGFISSYGVNGETSFDKAYKTSKS